MEMDIYKNFDLSAAAFVDVLFLSILLVAVLWLFLIIIGYKGPTEKSIEYLGAGSVFMGLAHMSEILIHYTSFSDLYFAIFFHRFLAIFGFIIIVWGFNLLMRDRY